MGPQDTGDFPGRGVWNEKLNHMGRHGDAVHNPTRRSAECHFIAAELTRLICDGAADQGFGGAHYRAGGPSADVKGRASRRPARSTTGFRANVRHSRDGHSSCQVPPSG